MDTQEFLAALRQCAGQYQWRLNEERSLRGYRAGTVEGWFCVLTAVACAYERGEYPIHAWDNAARALTVPFAEAAHIVASTDPDGEEDPALRQALLVAVGLAEGAP